MIEALNGVNTNLSLQPATFPNVPSQANEIASTSFGEMLGELVTHAISGIEKAENLSVAKMSGAEVPLREIVDSVMEAQQTLSATLAVRDKIVQAYLEVSHMQI